MKRLARIATAGLAGLSVALAGCGGDGDPASTASAPASKQEFIASADRICVQYGEKSHAMIDELPPFEEIAAPDVSRRVMLEVGTVAFRIAAVERGLERDLRALDPPADLARRWDRALGAFEMRAAAAKEIGSAGQSGDRTAYLRAFQRFVRAGDASTAALRDYGFKVCSRP